MIDCLMRWWGTGRIPDVSARQSLRFPVPALVSLVLENGVVVMGRLHDIGTGGAFIATTERPFGLAVGEVGDLGLASPDGIIQEGYRFPCKVVHLSRGGIGLQFLVGLEGEKGKYYTEGFCL